MSCVGGGGAAAVHEAILSLREVCAIDMTWGYWYEVDGSKRFWL